MIRIVTSIVIVILLQSTCHAQSFTKSLLYQNDHSFDLIHHHHFVDSSRLVLYLPSLYLGVSQKGPTITDYISRDASGQLLINPRAALPFAEDQNILQFGGRANGLGLAVQINPQITIAGSYGIRYISHVDYPLQTLDLYTAGNAFIFGEQLDLSFKMINQAFHNYTVAANIKLKSFIFGASVSLHSGIADASVERDRLLIEAKPFFYNIITDTDFKINTTDLIRYEGLQDIFVEYTGDFGNSFLSNNLGYSLSFFAQYTMDEKTRFTFKISDIGSINWKDEPVNYSASGINTFDGVNILDILNPNVTVSYQDSLEQLLDIVETTESYSTDLPLSFDVGAEHQLSQTLMMSAAFHYNSNLGFNNYSAGIAGHYQLSPSISLSGSLNHSTLSPISVGIGAAVSVGPVSLFAHTNNLLSIANQIKSAYNYTSLGLNIHFGSS